MISEEIRRAVAAAGESLGAKIPVQLDHPDRPDHGDYATNWPLLAFSQLKKQRSELASPLDLAKLLALKLPPIEGVARVAAAPPGFVNFWLRPDYLLAQAAAIVDESKFRQQLAKIGHGKTVVIDYSAPNIAKSFGIGHLRSTNIGQAIYNLYRLLGWRTIGDNHLGDWGTQFGRLIYMIKSQKIPLDKLTVAKLEELYVEFHRRAAQNPQLEKEGRRWFRRLEEGDREAKRIWQACVRVSQAEFDRIYRLLGVKIDYAFGESYYYFQGWMDQVLADARRRGLVEKSRGALVMKLPGLKVPAMLVKSDGATTYLLRDLATIKFRVQKWHPDLIVYEVGGEQRLHFQQVFLAAERLGYISRRQLVHLGHGLIRGQRGKFSTRRGRTLHLEEVINEGLRRARQLVKRSGQNLSPAEKEAVAQAVAVGGIKFNDLKQEIQRDIVFDWDKILAIEGYSAPYLQYTYARGRSILARGGEVKAARLPARLNDEELALLRTYYQFPEVLVSAANQFAPHFLAQYLFQLAQKFNLFYQKHRVLGLADQKRSQFRLFLVQAATVILRLGLETLGIQPLEKM